MCSPIAAFRLAWRLSSVTPHLPQSLRAYQRYLARITHVALYSLLFLYPLSGWAALSAYEGEFPIFFFGYDGVPGRGKALRVLRLSLIDGRD